MRTPFPLLNQLLRLSRALGWGCWRRWRLLERWARESQPWTQGGVCYGGEVLDLTPASLDPSRALDLPDQKLGLNSGFLKAGEPSSQRPRSIPPISTYLSSLCPLEAPPDPCLPGLTLAVQRIEWNNIYHTVVDLYNLFLISRFLHRRPDRILFMDYQQPGPFLELWQQLFGEVVRMPELPGETGFERLVVSPINHYSVLSACLGPRPPLLEEFSHQVRPPSPRPGEGQITLVSRQDCVQRGLLNLEELYLALRSAFAPKPVELVQFERMNLSQQLEVVGQTDLLIGAHGAGLTHSLFLPRSAGLLELFPGYRHAFRFHFYNIARWRGLKYDRWVDWSRGLEASSGRSRVDVETVVARARKLLSPRA